ncbi:hypothetical protein COU18_03780 [Candidatus Kaiserbacteria bacterium CG10_big_fil_rev_8_21_14_0_10_51_14]|uniref:Uncharacterized protein n=1 Tax=Candidatus Kaiserbacteria bacterium CG10_big_fil_rev_8_21_14_0_10_51_14 TaxID=1974610 RepID=A0A2H0UBG7_9BACT|nr:MAG: hypothetical protein COU18_03780 [Candidatus Kaiserbacteria bacterium CG10_big_fil_rev_8_21_14_0_10_51_14]
MEKLEQHILDEGRRDKRKRALGYDLPFEEHGEKEWREWKLQEEILTDTTKQKLFGELLRDGGDTFKADSDTVDAMFTRVAQNAPTTADFKLLNKARYEFSRRWDLAEKIGKDLHDEDIEYLAQQNGDFDALIGGVLNSARASTLMRGQFYRIAMQGPFSKLQEIKATQAKLKELRGRENFKKSNELAEKLSDRYGFSAKQWSQLEQGHFTEQQRKDERKTVGASMHWFKRWGTFGIATRIEANKVIRGKEKETREMVLEHLEKNHRWFKESRTRKIMEMVGEIKGGDAMKAIKEGYASIATILAASVSSDPRLRAELLEEAEGDGEAHAIDQTKPMTVVDFKNEKDEKGNLKEATFENDFQKHLRRRVDEGLDKATLTDPEVRKKELEGYQKQLSTTTRGILGFFVELMKALKRKHVETNKNDILAKDALWTIK